MKSNKFADGLVIAFEALHLHSSFNASNFKDSLALYDDKDEKVNCYIVLS